MRYEEFFAYIGDMGRYQIQKSIILVLPVFVSFSQVFSLTFIAGKSDFRCYSPTLDPEDNFILRQNGSRVHKLTGQASIGNGSHGQCLLNNGNDTSNLPCSKWIYDVSQYKTSIISEWNLVCGNAFIMEIVQPIYLVGAILGAFMQGPLSDRYGRKKVMMAFMIIEFLVGIGSGFSPNIVVFTLLRFLLGFAFTAIGGNARITALEIVGPSGRPVVTSLNIGAQSLSLCYLALCAYFLRYWRTLQIASIAPLAIIVICWWWAAPESIAWQVQTNKLEKARTSIRKASITNHVTLTEQTLAELEGGKNSNKTERKKKTESFLDLFRSGPELRRPAIGMLYIRFALGLMYFGISFFSSSIPGGNDYLNLALVGLTGIPAALFAAKTMEKFNRRPYLIIFAALGGILLIVATFLPKDLDIVALVIFIAGKLCIDTMDIVIKALNSEMIPTSIRANSIGVYDMITRLGGVSSSFIILLADLYHPYIPTVIMGAQGIGIVLVTLLMPETRGKSLPETIEDAKILYMGTKKGLAKKKDPHSSTAHANPAFIEEVMSSTPVPANESASAEKNSGGKDTLEVDAIALNDLNLQHTTKEDSATKNGDIGSAGSCSAEIDVQHCNGEEHNGSNGVLSSNDIQVSVNASVGPVIESVS